MNKQEENFQYRDDDVEFNYLIAVSHLEILKIMSRQDKERREWLEPIRMAKALKALKYRGLEIIQVTNNRIDFKFRDQSVSFWPYSGWASGKTIKNGRGLDNLINQIDYYQSVL